MEPPQIDADDFSRRFSLRASNLMWLLGAGASASAGIPTANDMVWEFKQLLFVSQRRVPPRAVADLSNQATRDYHHALRRKQRRRTSSIAHWVIVPPLIAARDLGGLLSLVRLE